LRESQKKSIRGDQTETWQSPKAGSESGCADDLKGQNLRKGVEKGLHLQDGKGELSRTCREEEEVKMEGEGAIKGTTHKARNDTVITEPEKDRRSERNLTRGCQTHWRTVFRTVRTQRL